MISTFTIHFIISAGRRFQILTAKNWAMMVETVVSTTVYACMGARVHGCMGVWLQGYMGVLGLSAFNETLTLTLTLPPMGVAVCTEPPQVEHIDDPEGCSRLI